MHFDGLFEREVEILEGAQIRQYLRVKDTKLLRTLNATMRIDQEEHHAFLIRFEYVLLIARLIVLVIVIVHVVLRALFGTQKRVLPE